MGISPFCHHVFGCVLFFVMGVIPDLIITQLPPFDNRAFYTIFSLYEIIFSKTSVTMNCERFFILLAKMY